MNEYPSDGGADAAANAVGPARSGDWTAQRNELFAWLAANASPAASIYAGAIAILDDDRIPARHYFIWHAIREIRSTLPRCINGAATARFEPDPLIRALATAWRREGLPLIELSEVEPSAEPDPTGQLPTLAVSSAVAHTVARLVGGFEAVSVRFRDANQQALVKVLGRDVPPYIAAAWSKAFSDAPKYAHIPNEPHPIDVTPNAIDGFLRFEAMLMTITRKSFENMDELDAILDRANHS